MPLELHPNDNAREARPGLWIFQGRSVVLLVVGVGAFVAVFRMLDFVGVDWPLNVVVSLLPLALMTAYVWGFVNGKAPSYAQDLLVLNLFRFRQWMYLRGVLNRPPQFWVMDRKPAHPNQFKKQG